MVDLKDSCLQQQVLTDHIKTARGEECNKYWLRWAPETGRGNKRYTQACRLHLKGVYAEMLHPIVERREIGPQIQRHALVNIGALNAKVEQDV